MVANPVKIKKGLKLGELDAESDQVLLDTCFVAKSELDELLDVSRHGSIIQGRTGSGKSALIYMISQKVEHSSHLDPNYISSQYLERSHVVQFFDEIGVRLDLFYRILWRHILAVELLKLRYDIRSEADHQTLISRIYSWVERDMAKKQAFDYFREWGDKFWLNTNEQLNEITKTFTTSVEAGIRVKVPGATVSLEGARKLHEGDLAKIKDIARDVVSGVQIQKIEQVVDLLSKHAFSDPQKKYYILIDKLDENWASTETRCRFIRALIEETKAFRKIKQIKIISALRTDLLNLVFDKTRDSGFQQEKYDAYLVPIIWAEHDLEDLLNKRVAEVFKRQYTSEQVGFEDLFPRKKMKHDTITPISYLIERTLMRPRDILQFANECFIAAAERDRISWNILVAAEKSYSKKRLKSLQEEWADYYPALGTTIDVLRRIRPPITRSSFTERLISDTSSKLLEEEQNDPCVKIALRLTDPNEQVKGADFVSSILMCLYHVGAIGIKISAKDTFLWSNISQPTISKTESKRATKIKVHKMLCSELEIYEPEPFP